MTTQRPGDRDRPAVPSAHEDGFAHDGSSARGTGEDLPPAVRSLDELPTLAPEARLHFACHPGLACFNACCADLDLVLGPYDVLRLRTTLRLDSATFDAAYADAECFPGNGFPYRRLRMRDVEGLPCPFVRPAGCAVYEDRPAACRSYPLGRAARATAAGGIEARLVVVREPHCLGFDEDRVWSASNWLDDQGLAPYQAMSDRYLELMTRAESALGPLTSKQARLVDLGTYRLDRFVEFAAAVDLLERLGVAERYRAPIRDDPESGLAFALDWLESTLLRDRERLAAWR